MQCCLEVFKCKKKAFGNGKKLNIFRRYRPHLKVLICLKTELTSHLLRKRPI